MKTLSLNNIRNNAVKVAKVTYGFSKHTLQHPQLTPVEKAGLVIGCAGITACVPMACFKKTRKHIPTVLTVSSGCLKTGFAGVLRAHVNARVDAMRENIKRNDEWLAEIREQSREDLFYAKAE